MKRHTAALRFAVLPISDHNERTILCNNFVYYSLLIYYMVYTHVKSFTVTLKNRKCGKVGCRTFPRMDFDIRRTFPRRRTGHVRAATYIQNAKKTMCRNAHNHDAMPCILTSDVINDHNNLLKIRKKSLYRIYVNSCTFTDTRNVIYK